MPRYSFDRQFADIFRRAGIDLGLLLRKSLLPEDLFGRRDIMLTRAEYFRLVETLGAMEKDIPCLAEHIAVEGRIETFSPPIFAANCSSNGAEFLSRFAHYKRLMGPVRIDIEAADGDITRIVVMSDDPTEPLPPFFAKLELLFLLTVLRRSTGEAIIPHSLEMRTPPADYVSLRFFGVPVLRGNSDVLALRTADLLLPFTSRNDDMWHYIEPELRRRLSEMEVDDTMAARVRSALVELLPAGRTTIDDVASKLCLSKRTMQRRLTTEGTTFQQQLNATRLLLARHYLKDKDRTSQDVAFLLGYEDTTSFLRAFSSWTGQTITEYRRKKR